MQLDTLVDGTVHMGAASVKSVGSRTITIALAGLPSGCILELVRGPVDLTGQDPGTTTVHAWSLGAGASTVSAAVDTASSCFVRPQLRRGGALVATGNPTWLLRSAPPSGIPAARAA